MARKKKKKRRLKKGAALVLKWSIAMIIIGTAAFFLMNMVYNRGIYVKTHPLVLDMEEDVSAEDLSSEDELSAEEETELTEEDEAGVLSFCSRQMKIPMPHTMVS